MKRVANGVVKPFIEGVQKILFANPTERKREQRQRDYEREHDTEAFEQKQLSKKAQSTKEKKAESMRLLRLARKPKVGTIIILNSDLLNQLNDT